MALDNKDQLDPDRIKTNLTTKRIGQKILVYKSTSSTNDVASEYASDKDNDGLVVFAEEQTAGRGRAGTKWHSGRGDSLLCSIVLTGTKINSELLVLSCAVATAEAIGKAGSNEAKIKWPNDIILNGKKAAGILVESKANNGDNVYILGIGINCHQKKESFPSELQSRATSIDIEGRTICDRISLAKRLLTSLEHWLEIAQTGSEAVTDRWCELSNQLGQRVTLSFKGSEFTGNCVGIDPEKGFILQLETGGVRMFDAAHTTIAK
ncbi:MAG: biotin--[acetyl-CoA-carboxylase] ligase [Planctomycetota bacterium]|nr:MAG: biotin--[acetyl-CoA-carboxylase] ligase [Planctomycetota bacterium]